MYVTIAAHSGPSKNETHERAKLFIEQLHSKCNPTILVGGYWGLMKTVVDEALRQGLKVVIILPIEKEDQEIPEEAITIKSGSEFRARSIPLVRSGDILVSLGGESGTMIEIMMAYAMGKPIYCLTNTGLGTDNLQKAFPKYLDQRNIIEIKYFNDPKLLAEEVCKERRKSSALNIG
ncbi:MULTISPECIES: hypothetical protein [Acidianus]|uniref:LOG family protein n=1 Tax=Candidatus Acidianus copahuensis TaxID=1160895 RepID=A0A031LJJ8_9CREN|nr:MULTISPECIES: hypothetical protein [Acidianus]EZQ02410.1 hypothetical protein CM19_10495 [Candidatus Acidianus copahuensis]NON63438.1 LOG family protein [Acidianus sp. RZ1]